MRRTFLIAAVVLSFLSLASAQRMSVRGGHGGVGFSHFGPRAPFFPTRGFPGHSSFFFSSRGFGVGWGFGPAFFPPRTFRRRVFYPGIPIGYPVYPAYAYSYPVTYDYPAYSSTSSYYPDVSYEQNRSHDEQDRRVTRELDRLSDEVEQLRAERANPAERSRVVETRSTVLVFRDKHIEEVRNYAVIGQTLWIFNEQRANRVPLDDLDISATAKLNEERGVEFVLPKAP